MKKLMKFFSAIVVTAIFFSSCTTFNKSIREPNSRVDFKKEDFELSAQVSGEATTTKILNIDWARLFNKNTGSVDAPVNGISLASLPVIGNILCDKTSNYALYEMMTNNQGYDVIFYPQYEIKVEKPFLGIGFFKKVITVKTTARLGKLK